LVKTLLLELKKSIKLLQVKKEPKNILNNAKFYAIKCT